MWAGANECSSPYPGPERFARAEPVTGPNPGTHATAARGDGNPEPRADALTLEGAR